MLKKRFAVFLFLSFIYAGIIFYISSKSQLHLIKSFQSTNFLIELLKNIGHLDKLGHVAIYFGFGIFLFLTFHYSRKKILQEHAILLALLTGLVYGVTDEIHQYFVPGRTASIMDLIADLIGLSLAQFFIIIILLLLKKRNPNSFESSQ